MILKTKLFGHVYEFKSIREVMAKANVWEILGHAVMTN